MTRPAHPQVHGIVETCINVSDMNRAREFYQSLFGFEIMTADQRFCAFRVGHDVLLLFTECGSDKPVQIEGGVIPPHETLGAGHFAFAISPDTLADWRKLLGERGVTIESEIQWDPGGTSLYFRDPDNNLVELATPGTWANY
jgi:catechol 2,3-dioxygenase-like lactoylglutathione lyase family enzyme